MNPSLGRLIVIDPCDAARVALAQRLRAQGYEVDEASDPGLGAEMALRAPPRAVLADLWMPTISGVQLCRLLRSESATTDIGILLFGEGDEPRDRFWAEHAGADGYVHKHRTGEIVRAVARLTRTGAADGFFLQLSGGPVAIRDRIARYLDAALFESVIASEVRALATAGTFDRVFDHLVQFLAQVTRYRWMAVTTDEPERLAIHRNPRVAGADEEARLALRKNCPDAVFLRIVDEDAHAGTELTPAISRTIRFGERLLGRIAISPRSGGDVESTTQLLNVIARELGGALRIAALIEESQKLAATDPLTGLCNRRALCPALDREVARAHRNHRPLTFALLDIDHFKRINDRYGHGVGDRVLAALGALLRGQPVRRTDLVARWGGEELVVVYPDTELEGGLIAANRLREAIEALGVLDDAGERVAVTASLGVAELGPGEAADELIRRADRAMYASKAAGRNRVTADVSELATHAPASENRTRLSA